MKKFSHNIFISLGKKIFKVYSYLFSSNFCVIFHLTPFSFRDSGYVGRTTQRLGDMIKQHVISNIRNKTAPQREQPPQSCRSRNTVKTSDSAIGQHLLDNPDCAKLYNDNMFRIISRARSSFHLAVLESIYIQTKKLPLCRQEFVFSFGLQW